LFSSPMPTPSQKGLREDSLRKLESELERRLEQERMALEKGGRRKCLLLSWIRPMLTLNHYADSIQTPPHAASASGDAAASQSHHVS
jgi:hypothetical protein